MDLSIVVGAWKRKFFWLNYFWTDSLSLYFTNIINCTLQILLIYEITSLIFRNLQSKCVHIDATHIYYCWDWNYCSKNLSKNDKKKQHTCWKFKGLLQSCSPHPYNWSFTFRVGIQILTDTSHAACGMYLIPKNLQDMSSVHRDNIFQFFECITFPTDFQSRTWCLETDVAWCCWWCTRYTTDLFACEQKLFPNIFLCLYLLMVVPVS